MKPAFSPAGTATPYAVFIADDFHYDDQDEPPYLRNAHPTLAAAIDFCKRWVDGDLEHLRDPRDATSTRPRDAAELYRVCCMFGDDPFIVGPGKVPGFLCVGLREAAVRGAARHQPRITISQGRTIPDAGRAQAPSQI